jgi:hypothetical protein
MLIYSGLNPQQSSGWTPLHQAAFMGAPKDRIIHLVKAFGALRMTIPLSTLQLPPFSLPHDIDGRPMLIPHL